MGRTGHQAEIWTPDPPTACHRDDNDSECLDRSLAQAPSNIRLVPEPARHRAGRHRTAPRLVTARAAPAPKRGNECRLPVELPLRPPGGDEGDSSVNHLRHEVQG